MSEKKIVDDPARKANRVSTSISVHLRKSVIMVEGNPD
jgi:hypothetical protein